MVVVHHWPLSRSYTVDVHVGELTARAVGDAAVVAGTALIREVSSALLKER